MSFAKRLMELQEEQWREATRIAVDAGVLAECDLHHEIYDPLRGNIEEAYRLGNYRYSHGKLEVQFGSRREMTDTIKAAVEDAAMECYTCAKWRDE